MSEENISGMFRVLSAILWIGNLKFMDTESEACQLTREDQMVVKKVARLLGVTEAQVQKVCTIRQISVKGTTTDIALKYSEVCTMLGSRFHLGGGGGADQQVGRGGGSIKDFGDHCIYMPTSSIRLPLSLQALIHQISIDPPLFSILTVFYTEMYHFRASFFIILPLKSVKILKNQYTWRYWPPTLGTLSRPKRENNYKQIR